MAQNQAAPDAAEATAIPHDNRRQHFRMHYQVEVTLESESNFYNGFTENISTGGLFIATFDIRPMGEKIQLEFTIPNRSEPVSVQGEVRWLREYHPDNPDMIPGMGVRFIDLPEQDQRDIETFLKGKDTIFYDDDL